MPNRPVTYIWVLLSAEFKVATIQLFRGDHTVSDTVVAVSANTTAAQNVRKARPVSALLTEADVAALSLDVTKALATSSSALHTGVGSVVSTRAAPNRQLVDPACVRRMAVAVDALLMAATKVRNRRHSSASNTEVGRSVPTRDARKLREVELLIAQRMVEVFAASLTAATVLRLASFSCVVLTVAAHRVQTLRRRRRLRLRSNKRALVFRRDFQCKVYRD